MYRLTLPWASVPFAFVGQPAMGCADLSWADGMCLRKLGVELEASL